MLTKDRAISFTRRTSQRSLSHQIRVSKRKIDTDRQSQPVTQQLRIGSAQSVAKISLLRCRGNVCKLGDVAIVIKSQPRHDRDLRMLSVLVAKSDPVKGTLPSFSLSRRCIGHCMCAPQLIK